METKNTMMNIRMTREQKEKIETGANVRGVNRTSYLLGLVEQDANQSGSTFYQKKTADILRRETVNIYELFSIVGSMDENIRAELQPIVDELVKGVEELWLSLK